MAVSDRAWMWIIVCGTIMSGGIATLSAKTLFQISTTDICDGKQPLFAKPYFLTVVRTHSLAHSRAVGRIIFASMH